jgi:hypothetical protein
MSSRPPRASLFSTRCRRRHGNACCPIEWVEMPLDRVLHESGSVMAYAYFPTTAIVSLTYETDDGSSIELAVVGNEGIVGVELLLGGGSTHLSCSGARRRAGTSDERRLCRGPLIGRIALTALNSSRCRSRSPDMLGVRREGVTAIKRPRRFPAPPREQTSSSAGGAMHAGAKPRPRYRPQPRSLPLAPAAFPLGRSPPRSQ